MDWYKFVEELPAGVAILDEKLNVLMVNKRIREKTGLDRNGFRNPLQAVHPEDLPLAIEAFRNFLAGEHEKIPYPILLRVVRMGGYQWNEIRWRVFEEEGKRYLVLTFTDVSKRVELQHKLESLLEYARLLNSILRHDIMNKITSIISYSEILEETAEVEKSIIEKIKQTAWKTVELIKKVKELEGSMGDLKPCSLADTVKSVAAGYDVELELEGDAVIMANDGLYSVFDNLFSNSVKHGNASRISVRIEKKPEKILVEFSDNGKGVPDEFRDMIFEKGFSTSGSTGYGLYIVKKLIESYGSSIRLKEGEKSTFILEFPETSSG